MSSAKERLLAFLQDNAGKVVSLDVLRNVAQTNDWTRSMRTLRQEGWDIETLQNSYILHSLIQNNVINVRTTISPKLRYAILQRDNSTCQRCGKTINDGIKLEVDHKIPVDCGGTNDPENLWTLCNVCNQGKKNLFSDFDQKVLSEVMREESGLQKLVKLFELQPNIVIEPLKLQVISGIRDWTRTVRLIRQKKGMDIRFVDKCDDYPDGGYINEV